MHPIPGGADESRDTEPNMFGPKATCMRVMHDASTLRSFISWAHEYSAGAPIDNRSVGELVTAEYQLSPAGGPENIALRGRRRGLGAKRKPVHRMIVHLHMRDRTTINLCASVAHPFVAFIRSLRTRDPKPTGAIHHTSGIILPS